MQTGKFALLAPVLQHFVKGYCVHYASVDKNVKTSIGNLRVTPDLALHEIPPNAAALVLVGATESWRSLSAANSEQIVGWVRQFKQTGRVVGAICDGTYFLAANGLLNDCKHTANSLDAIRNLPAYANSQQYVETRREAVRDGAVVTANATAFADFAIHMLHALGDVPETVIEQCRQMWQ